jgi:hypothetical protein
MSHQNPPIAVDERACAAAFGLSVAWLRADRIGARRLPFLRLGRCVRYDLNRVRESLARFEEGGAPSRAR